MRRRYLDKWKCISINFLYKRTACALFLELFLCLLILKVLQLKVIHTPKKHTLGWHVPAPFTYQEAPAGRERPQPSPCIECDAGPIQAKGTDTESLENNAEPGQGRALHDSSAASESRKPEDSGKGGSREKNGISYTVMHSSIWQII